MSHAPVFLREITSVEELIPFLYLRYRLFREVEELQPFCPENSEKIDLDWFDLHSHHLGLFSREGGRIQPIGYTRLIAFGDTPLTSALPRLAQHYATAARHFAKKLTAPWISPHYFPEMRTTLATFVKTNHGTANGLAEASRTCIESKFRSFGLTRWLFDCQMMFWLCHLGNWGGFTTCPTTLGIIYRRFGLKPMAQFNFKNMNFITLSLTRNDLSPSKLAELQGLSDAMHHEGCVQYSAASIAAST